VSTKLQEAYFAARWESTNDKASLSFFPSKKHSNWRAVQGANNADANHVRGYQQGGDL
jgi:hypothetical protein